MLAMMSYHREDSLRSMVIEDEHHYHHDNHVSEFAESLWANWELQQQTANQNVMLSHNHHHDHCHPPFCPKTFDWEAGATKEEESTFFAQEQILAPWKEAAANHAIEAAPVVSSHWNKAGVDTPGALEERAIPQPSRVVQVEGGPIPVAFNKAQETATSSIKRSKTRKPPSRAQKALTPLPLDFEPLPYSILCGQGNEYFNAIGNRRFRVMVSMFLQRYQGANDRNEKSAIVSTVMDILHEACPVGSPFIKYQEGRWWAVDEKTAREKVGAHFRDRLAGKYKSSAKAKIARRRERTRRNSLGGGNVVDVRGQFCRI